MGGFEPGFSNSVGLWLRRTLQGSVRCSAVFVILYLSLMKLPGVILVVFLVSCHSTFQLHGPERQSSMTGTAFYKTAAAMKWNERDSLALQEVLAGNIPGFLKKFVPVTVSIMDSATGKKITATFYTAPDYLSTGTDEDWARINITPRAAQRIADSLHCFLPTRKMVDDIYKAAVVKLEPVPMYAFRDSTPTMWQHHLIIEGQRKGRRGLIAGIKKDVVISGLLLLKNTKDRVAIYGWHKPDGKPIQPLYTGHVYWWVDYSQAIRLIYRKIKVSGKWMDYTDVLKDPLLRQLICNEGLCDYFRYDY